jgi:hypothetical protein
MASSVTRTTSATLLRAIANINSPTWRGARLSAAIPKLVRAKRIKQWTMYKRDEDAIAAVKRVIRDRFEKRVRCP